MAYQIQLRRDTSANWASVNPILAQGEIGIELDTMRFKIGDGIKNWNSLGYGIFDSLSSLLGKWSSTQEYLQNDITIYNGIIYIALKNNINKRPDINPNDWIISGDFYNILSLTNPILNYLDNELIIKNNSIILIELTTIGNNQTLYSNSSIAIGKRLLIINKSNSTSDILINNVNLKPSESVYFIWNGENWISQKLVNLFDVNNNNEIVFNNVINLTDYGLKDKNTTDIIKLSDINNTSLITSNKTLIGSINEIEGSKRLLSKGAVVLPSLTDNGDGSITVGDTNIINFYTTVDGIDGKIVQYKNIAGGTFTLVDSSSSGGIANYVYAYYNNGSPIIGVTTDYSIRESGQYVILWTIFRSNTTLHIIDWSNYGVGLPDKLLSQFLQREGFKIISGLKLLEISERIIHITPGIVNFGINSINLEEAISDIDVYREFYRENGNWVSSIATRYNNVYYDNGINRVELSNDRYAVNWIFRGVENAKHIYCIYGGGDYTLAQAQASVLGDIPDIISNHCVLVGKIIVIKGGKSATAIVQATSQILSDVSILRHNDLLDRDKAGSHSKIIPLVDTTSSFSIRNSNESLSLLNFDTINNIIDMKSSIFRINNISGTEILAINGTNNTTILKVAGDTQAILSISDLSASNDEKNWDILIDNNKLYFRAVKDNYSNAFNIMTFIRNGVTNANIGINTSIAENVLTILKDQAGAVLVKSADTNASTLGIGVHTVNNYTFIQSNKLGVGTVLPLTFWVGSNERIRIDINGNVGVNTSIPLTRMHIYDNLAGGNISGDNPQPSNLLLEYNPSTGSGDYSMLQLYLNKSNAGDGCALAYAIKNSAGIKKNIALISATPTSVASNNENGKLCFYTVSNGNIRKWVEINNGGICIIPQAYGSNGMIRFMDTNNSVIRWNIYPFTTDGGTYGSLNFSTGDGVDRLVITNAGSLIVNNYGIKSIGIYNNTSASGANVGVGADGQLYRSTSSKRYKKDIEDIEDKYSSIIYKLRPIWYRSLCQNDNKNWSYYGLIAEEVAEVEPRLVNWGYFEEDYEGDKLKENAELKPVGVQYERLTVLLIKEIQKLKKQIDFLISSNTRLI